MGSETRGRMAPNAPAWYIQPTDGGAFVHSGFSSERINLSPFTKDFRGEEQLNESIEDLFSGREALSFNNLYQTIQVHPVRVETNESEAGRLSYMNAYMPYVGYIN